MVGMRESSEYFYDLKFTKSIQWLLILAVAVARFLLSSGLLLMTPMPEILTGPFSECFFSSVMNS